MARRLLVTGLCALAIAWTYMTIGAPAPPGGALTGPAGEGLLAPLRSLPFASTFAPVVDATPTRLVIARLGIDASIEARGLDSSRNILTAKSFRNVAWYDLGPAPGQPGNALINGHVNWWTGDAVFTRLAQIRAGDEVVVIRADKGSVSFKVTAKRTVAWNARIASLFAPSQGATLTLITCTGVWDPLIASDTQRLLVSAVLE